MPIRYSCMRLDHRLRETTVSGASAFSLIISIYFLIECICRNIPTNIDFYFHGVDMVRKRARGFLLKKESKNVNLVVTTNTTRRFLSQFIDL